MTYNFLSQTNSSEFNLYEYVDDESLMIEATMGARMEYITNPYSYILTEDFESVRTVKRKTDGRNGIKLKTLQFW